MQLETVGATWLGSSGSSYPAYGGLFAAGINLALCGAYGPLGLLGLVVSMPVGVFLGGELRSARDDLTSVKISAFDVAQLYPG